MPFSIDHWIKQFPTVANDRQWFFVRGFGRVNFLQVRFDKEHKVLYLAGECHGGITKTSYGNRLDFFQPGTVEFCGPIKMPPDYVAGH